MRDSKSYRGVSFNKVTRRWRARIKVDGRSTHIGYFTTREEAAKKYDEFASRYHKDRAVINFQNNTQQTDKKLSMKSAKRVRQTTAHHGTTPTRSGEFTKKPTKIKEPVSGTSASVVNKATRIKSIAVTNKAKRVKATAVTNKAKRSSSMSTTNNAKDKNSMPVANKVKGTISQSVANKATRTSCRLVKKSTTAKTPVGKANKPPTIIQRSEPILSKKRPIQGMKTSQQTKPSMISFPAKKRINLGHHTTPSKVPSYQGIGRLNFDISNENKFCGSQLLHRKATKQLHVSTSSYTLDNLLSPVSCASTDGSDMEDDSMITNIAQKSYGWDHVYNDMQSSDSGDDSETAYSGTFTEKDMQELMDLLRNDDNPQFHLCW